MTTDPFDVLVENMRDVVRLIALGKGFGSFGGITPAMDRLGQRFAAALTEYDATPPDPAVTGLLAIAQADLPAIKALGDLAAWTTPKPGHAAVEGEG